MLWTKEIADFITLVAFKDDETELAAQIRESRDYERWYDIHLRCDCCGEVIPECQRRLDTVRETVNEQLRQYAVEIMGLDL